MREIIFSKKKTEEMITLRTKTEENDNLKVSERRARMTLDALA